MRAIQYPVPFTRLCAVSVAIYTRVSTLHQVGGRFDSCESQAAICREHIQKHAHEGWHEVACYTDAAYSGGTMNRPGIQALMRQIEAGEVKVVLIFKLERMLRSTDEWAPFRAFLQKHGCRLVSTTEDLSEETPSGRLKNNLLVSVAEYERLNTAEKVRAKMLEQAKRGFWNYGPVPFGYNYDAKTQTLQPNADESAIVRRVFEDAAQLVSLTEIANALGDEKKHTRVRVFHMRNGSEQIVGGRRFRSDTLRIMIKNPIYAGRVRFLGKEYGAQHTPLVSAELWERANAAIAKTHRPDYRLRKPDKHFHLLKGVVFCEHCGRALMPNTSGKRNSDGKLHRYYTCGYAQKERVGAVCPVRHVSATALEATVVGFLAEVGRHPEIMAAAVESSRVRAKTNQAPLRAKFAETDKALASIAGQLGKCVDALTGDSADLLGEELRARAGSLKEEKLRLLVEHERLRQELLACEQDGVDAERIRLSIERFGQVLPNLPREEQKELVALCIERVDVRAMPARQCHPGTRQLELNLKLAVARLVEGMEEHIVVETSDVRRAPIAKRLLVLKTTFALNQTGTATLLTPFQDEFGVPKKQKVVSVPSLVSRHPIHRALAWKQKLTASPTLTQSALAEAEHVKPATVSYHMNLLRLAPEIQDHLRSLATEDAVRPLGLVKMRDLAKLGLPEQRRRFAAMRAAITAGKR